MATRTEKSSAEPRVGDDVALQWDTYEGVDWERVLKGELLANAYCTRKGLSRKAQLAIYLSKHCFKRPTSPLCACLPRTVVLDIRPEEVDWCLADAREAIEEEQRRYAIENPSGKAPLWILKPSLADKAAEVTILRTLRRVREVVTKNPDLCQWVLQRYIERPLLLNGKKFHLRVHVLAVGRLAVYVHQDIIALVALEDYPIEATALPSPTVQQVEERSIERPASVESEDSGRGRGRGRNKAPTARQLRKLERREERMKQRLREEAQEEPINMYAHITNSCVQRDHPQFDEDRTVRLLEELEGELPAGAVSTIFERVKANVREIFLAFHGEFSGFLPLPNCFELFGFDFLVDDQLRPFILEVNTGPDLKNTGQRLDHAVSSLLEDTLRTAVDPYFAASPDAKSPVPSCGGGEEGSVYGRLHLVLRDDSFPDWGRPNMSFA